MVSEPVPTGPLAKALTTPVPWLNTLTLVLAPTARPPAFTLTPPPKRLPLLLSCTRPLPFRVRLVLALFEDEPRAVLMFSVGVTLATVVLPLIVTGAALMDRVAPLRSTPMAVAPAAGRMAPAPAIVATVPALPDVAVMLPLSVRMPLPVVRLGAVVPPSLSKFRPARV